MAKANWNQALMQIAGMIQEQRAMKQQRQLQIAQLEMQAQVQRHTMKQDIERLKLYKEDLADQKKERDLREQIAQLQIAGIESAEEAKAFITRGAEQMAPQPTQAIPQGITPTGIDRVSPTGPGVEGVSPAALLPTGVGAEIQRARPQAGMQPTGEYGAAWTEAGLREAISELPEDVRSAMYNLRPELFLPKPYQEQLTELAFYIETGDALPPRLHRYQDYISQKRDLDKRLENMQVTKAEYDVENARLDNIVKEVEAEYAEELAQAKIKQLNYRPGGGGIGGGEPPPGEGGPNPTDVIDAIKYINRTTGKEAAEGEVETAYQNIVNSFSTEESLYEYLLSAWGIKAYDYTPDGLQRVIVSTIKRKAGLYKD